MPRLPLVLPRGTANGCGGCDVGICESDFMLGELAAAAAAWEEGTAPPLVRMACWQDGPCLATIPGHRDRLFLHLLCSRK